MKIATNLILIGLLAFYACSMGESEQAAPAPIDPSLQAELAAWLAAEGKAPERYVIDLFQDHDVVFLGEYHRIKHDVLFVQSLIEPLHKAGVYTLATEFARSEDQAVIDSLLCSSEWDEDLAREIVFRQFIWWGFQEYVDILRSAGSLNRSLPDGERQFRVLGINVSPDWSHIKTRADRDDPVVMKKVWGGSSEKRWADIILDTVRSGEKVMVHCGIHHAFTEYRQPIVIAGEFLHFDRSLRCGNHVFAELGKRAVTVFLHAPWNGNEGYGSSLRYPADGIIDALMLAEGPFDVGFDLGDGPFGELRVKDAVYCHGYEDFKLSDFCDGWIYTKPITEYAGVTPISGWINEENLERARSQSPNPRDRNVSAKKFNRRIAKDTEFPRRWSRLR